MTDTRKINVNYINEVNAFMKLYSYSGMSEADINGERDFFITRTAFTLWMCLMSQFNRLGWARKIRVSSIQLMAMLNISKYETLYKARENLAKYNIITYERGGKRQATIYKYHSTVEIVENIRLYGTTYVPEQLHSQPQPQHQYQQQSQPMTNLTWQSAKPAMPEPPPVQQSSSQPQSQPQQPPSSAEHTPDPDVYPYRNPITGNPHPAATYDTTTTSDNIRVPREPVNYGDALFNKFFMLYPRKRDKKRAWKEWQRISELHHQHIFDGLKKWNQFEGWSKDKVIENEDGTKMVVRNGYIPYPEKFLHDGYFLQVPTWKPQNRHKDVEQRRKQIEVNVSDYKKSDYG